MFLVYVSKKTLPAAITAAHRERIKAWKKNGSKGYKPKKYETADAIIEAGLRHFQTPSNTTHAISKGDK